ncbi:MAG: carboxypeptidase regulatory-like domain-containing protein, partial [Candidatus Sericytochromatia bacterium]|nr:carboxypeptidase regulatory-like domain-containing protein [Candidatus Sericytochromatia bacterium]
MNRLWTWVVALAVFVVLGGAGAAIFALEIPTGSLDGQVLSPKKLPLSQVKVTAMGPVRRTVLTDTQGRYHFDRLRIGEYQMNTALYGYERQWQSEPVKIMEGKTTKGINFALVPTRPALNFSQYQRVFLPAEPLRIAYRGTLVDSVHLELSRTSLDGVLKLGSGEPKAHLGAHPDETLIASWDQKSPSTEDSSDFWFYRHIGLDKQPEGVYRLRMMGKATVDGQPFQTKVEETWFTISHVGIVAKRTPDTVLLYAVDLVTKQPLPGVQVAGGPTRTMRTAMGTTDKDGLLKVSGNTAPRTFVGTHGGAAAFLKLAAIARRDPEEGYAYTDRPIYRPEQTVHLKAVLRERTLSGFQVPAGRSVQLTISDASGEDVYKRQLTTNAMGAVDDDFTLGRQPSLGEYAAKFKLGDVTIDQTFEVKAYRKPEFRVDVAPAKRQLIAGEPLQATVSATYYFGAPVTGQKVRYTVYRTQTYPWMTDEDWFYSKYAGDGDSEYDWGYGEVVTSGTTQTDDAGHISLTVPTSLAETRQAYEPTHEYRYTVEVETTDQTNRAVTTRAAVIVAPSQVRAATDPARYVVGPGWAGGVTVKARNL